MSSLIDDKGRIWQRESRSLHTALGVPSVGEELGAFLIRNLGYVGIAATGSGAKIELRPEAVAPMAFSAMMYWLGDRRTERVLVSTFDSCWQHTVHATRAAAVAQLIERVTTAQAGVANTYLSRARDIATLPAGDPMRALLDVCDAPLDRSRLWTVLSNGFRDRYLAVQYMADRGALLIEGVGAGYNGFDKRWIASAIGQRVEDQPDYTYGKWIASAYRQALATNRPTLEDVDAVIAWPGKGTRRHRYRRLVLPFKRRAESTWLLSASLEDSAINLRPQVA